MKSCARLLISEPQNHSRKELIDSILDDVMITRHGRFLRPTDDSKAFCVVLSRSDAAQKVDLAILNRRWRLTSVPVAPKTCVVTHSLKRKNTLTEMTSGCSNIKKKRTLKKTKKTTAYESDSDAGMPVIVDCIKIDDDDSSSTSTEDPSLVCSPTSSFTFDKLYHHDDGGYNHNSSSHHQNDSLYGSPQDEIEMRRRLNKNRLPQSVGDVLLFHGARNIDDVILLVQSQPDLLKDLAVLDALKLRRAVQGNHV